MTDEEALKELESWDQDAWDKFKRENYEVISLGFRLEDWEDDAAAE